MDQIGSKLIKFDFWWSNHWNISSDFQFYFFLSQSIRSVENGSKWIKLDQIVFLTNQKSVTIKSSHIYHVGKNGQFIFDLIGSDLSKMDQTWPNWNSHQSKNHYFNIPYARHHNPLLIRNHSWILTIHTIAIFINFISFIFSIFFNQSYILVF